MSDKIKLEKLAAAKRKLKEFQSKQKSENHEIDEVPSPLPQVATQLSAVDTPTQAAAEIINCGQIQNPLSHFSDTSPAMDQQQTNALPSAYSPAVTTAENVYEPATLPPSLLPAIVSFPTQQHTNDVTQLVGELSAERHQNQELVSKRNQQYAEIAGLQSTIQHMQSQSANQITIEMRSLQDQVQSHVQTIRILMDEKNQLAYAATTHQQLAKQKADEIDELQGRLNASRHRVQTLEKEVNQVKSSHLKYDDSQQKLCAELESTQEEIRALQKLADDSREEIAELRQKLLLKAKDCDSTAAEVGRLTTELNLSQLRVEQFTAGDFIVADKKIEKLMQEKATVEQQLGELQAMVQQLGLERDQASQQYQNYVQHLNRESANLAQQVQELAADNERLSKRDAGLTKHVGDLERQIQQQLAKQQSLQETKAEAEEAASSGPNEMIAELTKKCEGLATARDHLWDRIRQQYEPELESLKQNLEEKLDTIDRLELTIERIRTESPDATNLLATIESDKVAASRAVSQNQDLKSQLDEIQKAYIQLSNDKLELTDRLQSEQHLGHEIKSRFSGLESELTTLKEKLYFKDEEMIRLSHENIELNKQLLTQLQELDRLRHYEATAAQTAEANRDMRRLRDETVNRLRKRIAELEAKGAPSSTTVQIEENGTSTNDETDGKPKDESTENREEFPTQVDGSECGSISSTLNIAADQAMDRLQQRFTRTMTEVADLTEEKHRLEHLVLQLQGETETIGEYIALYQNQRRLLKQREIEKDIQLQQITVEREQMKDNVMQLNNLVAQLLLQNGVEDAKQLVKTGTPPVNRSVNVSVSGADTSAAAVGHHDVRQSTNIHDVQPDVDGHSKNVETASEIIRLLSEIKERNLHPIGYGVPVLDIHHCPCCSGKLETV